MMTDRTAEHIRQMIGDGAESAADAVYMLTSVVPRKEAWHKLVDSVLEAQKTVLTGLTEMIQEQQTILRKGSGPRGPQPIQFAAKGRAKKQARRS